MQRGCLLVVAFILLAFTGRLAAAAEEPPTEWIEASTGHRVVRLSREGGSASLYFHQNPYTAEGDKLLIAVPGGLATVDLKTRQIDRVLEGYATQIVVGRKSRQVYYTRGSTVYAAHLDTHATREIGRLSFRVSDGLTVNADETLLAGSFAEGGGPGGSLAATTRPVTRPSQSGLPTAASKGAMMERRFAQKIPMALFTINTQTGEVRTFNHCTDWLNHVQFSPADPNLLMFAHEGPWHKLDRPWLIRTDGTELRAVHKRAMDMEISGHEFWNPDGRIVWYDLQTPKSRVFWLAGRVLATNELIKYSVQREHWSVHYNVSADGKLFAGDGGGPSSVAAPGNGQWIYLFAPKDGALQAERLVDLSKHDYRLEPNITFTPDMKWLVFRSNMHGASHVYAVEIEKTKSQQ